MRSRLVRNVATRSGTLRGAWKCSTSACLVTAQMIGAFVPASSAAKVTTSVRESHASTLLGNLRATLPLAPDAGINPQPPVFYEAARNRPICQKCERTRVFERNAVQAVMACLCDDR